MAEGIASIRRYFTADDIAYIVKRRNELAAEGKKDKEISRVLAKEMERSAGSIREKIRWLVKRGGLGENRNKLEKLSEEEVELIIRRRNELAAEGKKDTGISKILAKEMGRNARSIEGKIGQLVGEERLGENGNKREKNGFSEAEIALIIRRRNGLAAEGKKDGEISRILAKEIRRSADSVRWKIGQLVKGGKLGENRNKQEQKPMGFYSSMSDDELVGYARRFMKANGILGRSDLKEADSGLYAILIKRKFLDRVFASINQAKEDRHLELLREAVALYLGDTE